MSAARLFLRCIAWGLATGAAVGGIAGFVIGALVATSTGPAMAAFGLFAGIFYGALVAVVPTVLGGLVVVVVLLRRHPHPASFLGVQRDLGVVFASVVVALDLVVLAWWIALGGLTSQVLVLLVALLLIDTAAAAVLTPARSSIAQAWSSGEP